MRTIIWLFKCILIPVQLCLVVKLHLSSGDTIRFSCTRITVEKGIDGVLGSLSADDTRGFPLMITHKHVIAVTKRQSLRLRFWLT